MWTMSTDGFLSAVAHRQKPGYLMVRARNEQDIRALAALIPGAEPYTTNNSDYHWRLVCTKDEYKAAACAMIDAIDYGNFKNAVGRKSAMHAHAYHKVWNALLSISPTKGTNYSFKGGSSGLWPSEKPIVRKLHADGKTPAAIAKALGNGATTKMVKSYLASEAKRQAKTKPKPKGRAKPKNRKAGTPTLPGVK